MGLDITAYSNLTHIGRHAEDWCPNGEHIQAYAYADFPLSFRGIPVLAEHDGSIHGGCYIASPDSETFQFRAGSYSGYNCWRRDLATQFNPKAGPNEGFDLPFFELIWFADNEGCIGPEAAADLLADFQAHADAYTPGADAYDEWYREKYTDWTRAFKLAADGGLVSFH